MGAPNAGAGAGTGRTPNAGAGAGTGPTNCCVLVNEPAEDEAGAAKLDTDIGVGAVGAPE